MYCTKLVIWPIIILQDFPIKDLLKRDNFFFSTPKIGQYKGRNDWPDSLFRGSTVRERPRFGGLD